MLPVTALRPCSGNARTHSKRQVTQIMDSIRRFGFTTPCSPVTMARSSRAADGSWQPSRTLPVACSPSSGRRQRSETPSRRSLTPYFAGLTK
jgi:hypothetical protein